MTGSLKTTACKAAAKAKLPKGLCGGSKHGGGPRRKAKRFPKAQRTRVFKREPSTTLFLK